MRVRRNSEDQEIFLAWLPQPEQGVVRGRAPGWRDVERQWHHWWMASGIYDEVIRAFNRGERLFLFDPQRHYPPWHELHVEPPEEPAGHRFELGRNPDPRQRDLERRSSSGDLRAAAQWVRERQRAGETVDGRELVRLGLAVGLEKLPYDKRGDMVIRTGHKAFDRQTRVISPGSVVGPTQYSQLIRAFSDVKAYSGAATEPGKFQEWDLHVLPGIDPFVAQFIRNNAKVEPAIAYMFRVSGRGPQPWRDLGYVVTRQGGQLLGVFARDTPKARAVIEAVTPVVSWRLRPEFADLIPTRVRGSTPHHTELWRTLTPNPPIRPCGDPYCRCLGDGHPCAGCGAEECSCRRCERCKRLVKGRRGGGAPLYVTEEDEILCGRCYKPNENPPFVPWHDYVEKTEFFEHQLPRLSKSELASAVYRIVEVGGVPPLTYQGAGASGLVFCDQRGHAFKAARRPDEGSRGSMRDEADWFRAAAARPQTVKLVPKLYAFYPEQVVIERDCVEGERPGWRAPVSEWHEQLAVPGWTRPEGGERQWIVTEDGPVIVDGGYALRQGPTLADHVEAVLDGRVPGYGESLKDMAWAIYVDRNLGRIHPHRAEEVLARLRAAGDVSEWSEPGRGP